MSNLYWRGDAQAALTPEQVKAPWGRDNASIKKAVELLNFAFEIFYQARQNIKACPNPKTKKKMTEGLEDTATEGMLGDVPDLKTAFEHLAKSDGGNLAWTDDTLSVYEGSQQPGFFKDRIRHVPSSAVNFLRAVEEKNLMIFVQEQEKIAAAERLTRSTEQSKDGEKLGAALKTIHSSAKRIESLLWLAPYSITQTKKGKLAIQLFKGAIEDGNTVATYYDTLDVMDTTIKNYFAYREAGLSEGAAAGLECVRLAVGLIPIFGEFYKEFMSKLPTFFQNYRDGCAKTTNSTLGLAHSDKT